MTIELTLFTKYGGPLTKHISLAPDGTLIKNGNACKMSIGMAERVKIADVNAFSALIESLASEQAIALGMLRPDLPDRVQITTKAKLMNGAAQPGIIARTKDNIVFHGPAPALFDYDTKGMPAAVADRIERADGFVPALLRVLPALVDAPLVIRRSTSAGLWRFDTNEMLPGSDGWHVYVLVKDGKDIERFLGALHERCWLAGFRLVCRRQKRAIARTLDHRCLGRPA
jgi:hypothetical protein